MFGPYPVSCALPGRLSGVSVDRVPKPFDSRHHGRRKSLNLCGVGARRLKRSSYLLAGELRGEGREPACMLERDRQGRRPIEAVTEHEAVADQPTNERAGL